MAFKRAVASSNRRLLLLLLWDGLGGFRSSKDQDEVEATWTKPPAPIEDEEAAAEVWCCKGDTHEEEVVVVDCSAGVVIIMTGYPEECDDVVESCRTMGLAKCEVDCCCCGGGCVVVVLETLSDSV